MKNEITITVLINVVIQSCCFALSLDKGKLISHKESVTNPQMKLTVIDKSLSSLDKNESAKFDNLQGISKSVVPTMSSAFL